MMLWRRDKRRAVNIAPLFRVLSAQSPESGCARSTDNPNLVAVWPYDDGRAQATTPSSPADKIADFLLNVAQVQETMIRDKIAVGSIPYDVERSMSERMSATRRVVHYYRIAVNAYSEGPHDDPDTLSLPGITLALAILADSHPRAPGYVNIAPYTQQILEDYS